MMGDWNKMTVGQSSRTPGKHALLRTLTGREIGVTRIKRWAYTMIDLCAGDGRNTDSSGTCSPRILTEHRNNEDTNYGRTDVSVILIEKAAATFTELQANHPDTLTIHGDARNLPELLQKTWLRNDAVFVQNDPNTINDWALSNKVLNYLPSLSTTYSTLGCNVGGLKRLPSERRREWYEHVDAVIWNMPKRHDALLIALNGDASQWAYLVTGPAIWRDKYMADATKAFRGHPNGITTAWCKDQWAAFKGLRDELFLQKQERIT